MQVNGNVYHAYTLEDLILIKVYCTNQGSLLLQLNSIKILMHFSGSRIDNPKICMKYRRSWIASYIYFRSWERSVGFRAIFFLIYIKYKWGTRNEQDEEVGVNINEREKQPENECQGNI